MQRTPAVTYPPIYLPAWQPAWLPFLLSSIYLPVNLSFCLSFHLSPVSLCVSELRKPGLCHLPSNRNPNASMASAGPSSLLRPLL